MELTVFGYEITGPVLALGLITGLTYGLLAVGLVLVHRSNRVINFAHGEIGAAGAAVLGLTVTRWDVPYWIAFPGVLVLSGVIAAISEIAVVRRLRKAPKLMSIVGTLGVAQFILLFSVVINSQARAGSLFPQPPGLPDFHLGALRVTPAYAGMLLLTPLLVLGLVVFLRYSRYGVAIRAAASNIDAARLAGISASRMSSLAWGIAGVVSAFTAILILPTRGFVTGESFGPGLLLRALVGAVIARMTSLPIALVGGVGVGVAEQLLLWNYPQGGLVEVVLFGTILGALLLQPRHSGRGEDKGSWAAVQAWAPLPDAFLRIWAIRNMGKLMATIGLVVALLLPIVATNSASTTFVAIIAFVLVGLSVGLVTGLAGQISLGQFALAGVGAYGSFWITSRTGNFLLGFVVAGLLAAAVAVLVGLPALRIRGLMLAVTTLSFALVVPAWLLQQSWMFGSGIDPGRPIIGTFAFDTGKRYYLLSVVILALGFWLANNVWRSGLARRLIAVRDNEEAAKSFTVPSTLVKLQVFALGGFLAGLGGAVFSHALARVTGQVFPSSASIDIVALSAIGGIGIIAGPLIGALYIIGVPRFVPLDSAGLAASSLGWLILILYFPGGIAQMISPLRTRLVHFIARRSGVDPARVLAVEHREESREGPSVVRADAGLAVDPDEACMDAANQVLLDATNLTKRFGGVVAVSSVDLRVVDGETLGLIGPNGAGKTTLFEVVGGFTRPDEGRIVFEGRDISRLGAEARGRAGVIRSFQDASLFPTMTVLETIQLAHERRDPTHFFPSVVGYRRPDARKEAAARELAHFMGLESYQNKQIGELSTGTRRITELTCLLALEPRLLLLDEPSSGVAQRETEALGELLRRVKTQLRATFVIIEHDMPLIMGLSDRIVAMESGQIIANGAPSDVRTNPLVIESYLGGDVQAIARSGLATVGVGAAKEEPGAVRAQCSAATASGEQCSRAAGPDGLCGTHRHATSRSRK